MMNKLTQLFSLRFWPLFILPNIIFLILADITDAAWLIGLLNSAVLALAVAVCVSYAPAVVDILFTQKAIKRHDWLAHGIFLSWGSIIVLRLYSITWHALGKPLALSDSDFISYGLFMSMIGAMCHLAAPGGVDNRVPTVRWVKIGALIALAIFAALLLGRTFATAELIDRATAAVFR